MPLFDLTGKVALAGSPTTSQHKVLWSQSTT